MPADSESARPLAQDVRPRQMVRIRAAVTTTIQSPTLALNNHTNIPQLGLGVYQVPPGEVTVATVRYALDLGYRHIDTARWYSNERDVGKAVRESGVPREQIYVTTKLANPDHG